MGRNNFINLIAFYASFLWFVHFARLLLPLHFIQQGLTPSVIILGYTVVFAANAIPLILSISIKAKRSWYIGIFSYLLFILLVINIKNIEQYYLAFFLQGITVFFLYIPYNIAHFVNTPKERTGMSSGLMFAIPALVGILAPLLGGILAQNNFNLIFIFSFLFFLFPLFLIQKQEDFLIKFNIKEALNEIRPTRFFVFLHGIWDALVQGVIPIFPLFFLKTPLFYGTYLSYLALAGIAGTLILGHSSDKLKKRTVFIYPITIATAICTVLFTYSTNNIVLWIILAGIIQIFNPILHNVTTALVVDSSKNMTLAMTGRELALTIGRVVGLTAAFFSLTLEKTPSLLFLFLASCILLYGFLLFYNSKIIKKYKYL